MVRDITVALSRSIPYLMAMKNQKNRLIVDTDVGMDDLFAIRGIIAGASCNHGDNGRKAKDIIMTTVTGMTDAHVGASYLRTLFPEYNVLEGCDLEFTVPEWLHVHRKELRDSMSACDGAKTTDPSDFETLYSFLQESSDDSVDLLCLGPLSNTAHWLATEEKLSQTKIANIWIMGGNDPHSTSTPEFNFSLDPAAAHSVLSSNMSQKIRLVTGTDISPKARPSLVQKLQHLALEKKDEGGFFLQMFQKYPQRCCFDPICAFLMQKDHSSINFSTRQLQNLAICGETGLLRNGTTEKEGLSISLVRPLDFEDDFIEWIGRSVA